MKQILNRKKTKTTLRNSKLNPYSKWALKFLSSKLVNTKEASHIKNNEEIESTFSQELENFSENIKEITLDSVCQTDISDSKLYTNDKIEKLLFTIYKDCTNDLDKNSSNNHIELLNDISPSILIKSSYQCLSNLSFIENENSSILIDDSSFLTFNMFGGKYWDSKNELLTCSKTNYGKDVDVDANIDKTVSMPSAKSYLVCNEQILEKINSDYSPRPIPKMTSKYLENTDGITGSLLTKETSEHKHSNVSKETSIERFTDSISSEKNDKLDYDNLILNDERNTYISEKESDINSIINECKLSADNSLEEKDVMQISNSNLIDTGSTITLKDMEDNENFSDTGTVVLMKNIRLGLVGKKKVNGNISINKCTNPSFNDENSHKEMVNPLEMACKFSCSTEYEDNPDICNNFNYLQQIAGPKYIAEEEIYETSNNFDSIIECDKVPITSKDVVDNKKKLAAVDSELHYQEIYLDENADKKNNPNSSLEDYIQELFEVCNPDEEGLISKRTLLSKLFSNEEQKLPDFMEKEMKASLLVAKEYLTFSDFLSIAKLWETIQPHKPLEESFFSQEGSQKFIEDSFDLNETSPSRFEQLSPIDPIEDHPFQEADWRRSTLLPRKNHLCLQLLKKDLSHFVDESFSPIKMSKTPEVFKFKNKSIGIKTEDDTALLNYTTGSIETENNGTVIDPSEMRIELQEVRGSNDKLQIEKEQLKQMVVRSENSHQALVDRCQELEDNFQIAEKKLAEYQNLKEELADLKVQHAAEIEKAVLITSRLYEDQLITENLIKSEEKLKEKLIAQSEALEYKLRNEEQMSKQIIQFSKEITFMKKKLDAANEQEILNDKEMERVQETNKNLQQFIQVLQQEKLEIWEQLNELRCLNQSLITPPKLGLDKELFSEDENSDGSPRFSPRCNVLAHESVSPLNIHKEILKVEPLPTLPPNMAISTCSPWSLDFPPPVEIPPPPPNIKCHSTLLPSADPWRRISYLCVIVAFSFVALLNTLQFLEDNSEWKPSTMFTINYVGEPPF